MSEYISERTEAIVHDPENDGARHARINKEMAVNHKKVQRIYRELGLSVKRMQRKHLRRRLQSINDRVQPHLQTRGYRVDRLPAGTERSHQQRHATIEVSSS